MDSCIPVFRNGMWIQYQLPKVGLEMWSNHLKLQVASLYASSIVKGNSKEKSSVLAECYANKQLYKVQYPKELEESLQELLV
jgi:hypothetical protein